MASLSRLLPPSTSRRSRTQQASRPLTQATFCPLSTRSRGLPIFCSIATKRNRARTTSPLAEAYSTIPTLLDTIGHLQSMRTCIGLTLALAGRSERRRCVFRYHLAHISCTHMLTTQAVVRKIDWRVMLWAAISFSAVCHRVLNTYEEFPLICK